MFIFRVCVFQKKKHPWGDFLFPGFPCSMETHEGAGPATGSQTAWNRADGAVKWDPSVWAFQPRGPLFLLTYLGPTWISRTVELK